MSNAMKSLWKPFVTGIAITTILFLWMVFVSMNFQYILALSAALFYAAGRLHGSNNNQFLALLLVITWSFTTVFIVFVLTEIPQLYYIIIIYSVACFLGLWFRTNKIVSAAASFILVGVLLFISEKVIPSDLNTSLSQEINKPLPTFAIKDMHAGVISKSDMAGKVVVLDFFGTWCKPCIQELKELDKVERAFTEDSSVVFYVVNADLGGDTPEKFKSFISKVSYNFKYGYDEDSKLLKSLKLGGTGLPLLILIDKRGQISWSHTGYNPAETNFENVVVDKIRTLQSED
jgi:thiol-disulfide isomerase/thioredoxin